MASLKLNAVNKVYPSGESALYDVNFSTRDKEFIVIVGGECGGKSTLLRVIAGLEQPTSGAVFIDGKDVTEVEPKDRDVAMIFRSSTLYPAQNVFDNMAFGLRLRKAPPTLVEQRVKAAATILGLEDVLYRKPKTLSAAAKQRVAIGRAMVREPKLYLFDEPLSGLDENLRADMLNVIINLQARMEGTFIYATKNLAEAMAIGTRIVVMKNGFIQQIDTPANLYDYPANAYVAFYIGSPSISLIDDAHITRADGAYFVEAGGLKIPLSENTVKRFTEIEKYANAEKTVVLGIRPEDAALCKGGIKAVVSGVNEKGGKTYADCTVDGAIITATAGEAELSKGSEVELCIDASHLYLFDGETRLTVLARDDGYKKTDFEEADFTPMPIAEENAVTESLKPVKDAKKKKNR